MINSQIISEDLEYVAQANLPWEMLRNKSVLITGCGGFLPSYLMKCILHASQRYGLNCRVVGLGRGDFKTQARILSYAHNNSFRYVKHNVCDPLPQDFPASDYIVHAASQASPKYYGSDPVGTLLANSTGTANLLAHSRQTNRANRFLFISSGEVYGQCSEQPIKENIYGYLDPMSLRSCYAESKRIGETMCVAWAHQFGIHTIVARPFHTYGPGMALDDGRVFADFVGNVIQGQDILLKSDGQAKRPFCYIADAAIGFLTVLFKGESSEAYNVGNPSTEISMIDLAKKIAGIFPELNIGVTFDRERTMSGYINSPLNRSCPSINKIENLGWKPKIELFEGFKRTILSYK